MLEDRLVENRRCDECTVCCKVLPIDTSELQKQSGILCTNCQEGGGCLIYAARPKVCSSWYCGWRAMPQLGDNWRPDRSGILIELEDSNIPIGYGNSGFKFFVIGSEAALDHPYLAELLGGLVEARIPAFLSVPGPVGYYPAKAFLNDQLSEPVANRDRAQAMNHLRETFRGLQKFNFDPVILKDRW